MSLTLTLAVADLERTAAFYALLGLAPERFVPLPGHAPVLLLAQGDAAILFREGHALATRHPTVFQDFDRQPRGIGTVLEFSVADISGALRAIERHRIVPCYELEDDEFRRREVWLHDPDGYLVVLAEEPTPPAP